MCMREIAQAVNKNEHVKKVDTVEGNFADYVIQFSHEHGIQELRTEWLKNHREDFELGDYQKNGENSWIHVSVK